MAKSPRITVYTTDRCAHCRAAKDFLKRHRLGFREANIGRDRRAQKEFERLGARAVPVILVGEHRLNGFDPKRLAELLARAGVELA
jgi:glutaredoxin